MDKTIRKVLIVGAGDAGSELAQELRKISRGYKLIGFIDDDVSKQGKKVNILPVLGEIDDIGFFIRKYDIDEILIAIPSADGQTIRRILESAKGLRMKFKIVPRTLEIVQGEVHLYQLRELEITDLWGRAIVKSHQPAFQKEFKGKRIFVTGAAGSIGSELCRQLIQFYPLRLTAFDWWENGLFELESELAELTNRGNFECMVGNVQDRSRVKDAVGRMRPDIIFHAAAFKHVPLMQENPFEAIRNNVFGTENVAKIAYEEGVEKFIYVSTDKAADPKSVMGATKLIGEHVINTLNSLGRTKYSAVRFGNVLESHGSVVPLFRKQIANGGPVTVTDPRMTRFMMTIPEAVQLVLEASRLANGGEIFMLYMGERIKIDELARFMIQLAGFIPNKDIVIKYVGARAGEKLSEQLVGQNEYVEITNNDMIFNVKREISKITNSDLARLKTALDKNNTKGVLLFLKNFAPNLKLYE